MVFVETDIFTKSINQLLSDEEYKALQLELFYRPEAGSLIKGSGGIRKIRWKGEGVGKRSGIRVVYYIDYPEKIFMLFAYKKNKQEDLTPGQLKQLKNLISEWLL